MYKSALIDANYYYGCNLNTSYHSKTLLSENTPWRLAGRQLHTEFSVWQIGKSSIFSLRMMEDWSICQRRGILCEVGAHPAIVSAHQIVWYSCQLIDSRAPAQVCERWLPSLIWWVWLHGTPHHGGDGRIEINFYILYIFVIYFSFVICLFLYSWQSWVIPSVWEEGVNLSVGSPPVRVS